MGRYFERWITDLPRERFAVHVYHQASIDPLAKRLAARADVSGIARAGDVADCGRIRNDALDVLVFPESA